MPALIVEVTKQVKHLPADVLNSAASQVDIQVIGRQDETGAGGAIVHAMGGLTPASNGDVNTINYPFLAGFASLPPIIGAAAGAGDTLTVMRIDMEHFAFCLMDESQPAWLYILPRANN